MLGDGALIAVSSNSPGGGVLVHFESLILYRGSGDLRPHLEK
jgi:hypothetical protein